MCATCNFKKSDSVEGQEPDTAEIQARILSSGKSLPVCNSLNTKEIMVIRRTHPDIKVRAIAKEVLRWRNKEKEINRQKAKEEAKNEAVDTGDSA
jgi:putative NIF3 family GTP cyclohydrolase 1 type 2